ncbi:MAG TPA: patatin-like phospholipase family protein [Mariprofundaceae bacterium]|nr:patatin-like phospholipase family protein [Mariprofundaceae bacterium]
MKGAKSDSVVLALGGGGARGLAHIGVLEVLKEARIPVRAVVGTSVGAEIGAFYAAGTGLEKMRRIALRTDWLKTLRLFTPDFGEAGFSSGKGIRRFLEPYLDELRIEALPIGFAALATDLITGEEVVLDSGSLIDAVCASLAFPGLISPTRLNDRLLVDGGLVNPVPFDAARERFGGPVIAVLAHSRMQNAASLPEESSPEWRLRLEELLDSRWLNRLPPMREWLQGFREANSEGSALKNLGVSTVLSRSQMISEVMLVELRQRLLPPDLMLAPVVEQIGLLEFYRAREAIVAGRKAAQAALPGIRKLLG